VIIVSQGGTGFPRIREGSYLVDITTVSTTSLEDIPQENGSVVVYDAGIAGQDALHPLLILLSETTPNTGTGTVCLLCYVADNESKLMSASPGLPVLILYQRLYPATGVAILGEVFVFSVYDMNAVWSAETPYSASHSTR